MDATTSFLPTANDDAQRQQLTSRFFYLVGDVLKGSDTTPRIDPNLNRSDGLLGPTQQSDVAIGLYGDLYYRGRAGDSRGVTGEVNRATTGNGDGGLALSGQALLLLALAAWFVLRHH